MPVITFLAVTYSIIPCYREKRHAKWVLVRSNAYPHAAETFNIVEMYNSDNRAWLKDFEVVFTKMLKNGLAFDDTCYTIPCSLSTKFQATDAGLTSSDPECP